MSCLLSDIPQMKNGICIWDENCSKNAREIEKRVLWDVKTAHLNFKIDSKFRFINFHLNCNNNFIELKKILHLFSQNFIRIAEF